MHTVRRLQRLLILPASLLMVSGVLVAAQSSFADAATKAPLVVGVISTNTAGTSGGSENQVPTVVTDWQKWVNSHGGINGHSVSVISENDAGSPTQSLTEAHQLVADHVVAIFDETELDTTWGSYIQKLNIPVIAMGTSGNSFGTSEFSDFFATAATAANDQFGQTYLAAKVGHAKTYAEFICAELAACKEALPLVKANSATAGMKLVYSAALSASAPNYTAQCLAAKQNGAQAIGLGVVSAIHAKIFDDCAQQGFHPVWTIGGMSYSDLKDPNSNGAVVYSPSYPAFENGTPVATMRAALGKDFNQIATWPDGGSLTNEWGALVVFQAAAAHVPAKPTSAADILKGLYALHNFTAGGVTIPLTYTKGKPTLFDCFFGIKIVNQKFTDPWHGKFACKGQAPPA